MHMLLVSCLEDVFVLLVFGWHGTVDQCLC